MKKSHQQSGIGLVEVMVASAMLGGLSLVVMQLSDNSQKSVVRMEKGMEAVEIDGEINSMLSNKTNCTATMTGGASGLPIPLADMTSPSRHPPSGASLQVQTVDPATNTSTIIYPMTPTFKRNLLTMTDIYITGYTPTAVATPGEERPANTAYLIKKYSFKLGPNSESTKTKQTLISITPDLPSGGTTATDCIAKAAEGNDVWTVNNFGIFYDDLYVAIGKPTISNVTPRSLDIAGGVIIGPRTDATYNTPNTISGASPTDNGNNIFGGYANTIDGTTYTNAIVSGQENYMTNAYNSLILGGLRNTVSGTARAGVIIGGGMNNAQGWYSTLIGGSSNASSPGANYSAVLAGSGNTVSEQVAAIVGGLQNTTLARYSVILGGERNRIMGAGTHSGILGGTSNSVTSENAAAIGGHSNRVSGQYAVAVGGGGSSSYHMVRGRQSAIIGGRDGITEGIGSVITGGALNDAYAENSVVLGGYNNGVNGTAIDAVSGVNSATVGGSYNNVDAYDSGVFVGQSNNVTGQWSAVIGGIGNYVSGLNSVILGGSNSKAAGARDSILGGFDHSIAADTSAVSIAGGYGHTITGSVDAGIVGGQSHVMTGAHWSAIIGGTAHRITNIKSTILGGESNTVSGPWAGIYSGIANLVGADGHRAVVMGGTRNRADAWDSGIVGGYMNAITSGGGGARSAIVGGNYNRISSAESAIVGGWNNVVMGTTKARSVIIGGFENIIESWDSMIMGTDNMIIAGDQNIIIGHDSLIVSGFGNMILSDGLDELFAISGQSHTLKTRFNGGYEFCINTACNNYAKFPNGASSWSISSDKNLKKDFKSVDEEKVLSSISELDVTTWVYKDSSAHNKKLGKKEIRNIGPMAQDFYRLFAKPFGLSSSETSIASGDVYGMTLVGVKGLEKRTTDLREENEILKAKVSSLEERLEFLEKHIRTK
ncbi:MAG TPA: tail fiber domain-containing protein [Bacteriovoracaceae bacterium]|nr:tail fiber domain-containing protein [Bacteriovoracaceae bacterium]